MILTGAASALLALSGCASASSGASARGADDLPAIIVGAAILDTDHEDVVMPLGEFQLTASQAALLRNASDVLVQQCLDQAQVDVRLPQRQREQHLSVTHFSFGVWTDARASLYGYSFPPHPTAIADFETDLANGDLSRLAAVRTCNELPEVMQLDDGMDSNGQASRGDSMSWSQMEADPRTAPNLEAHRACMAGRGFQIGDDWAVEGVESMNAEQKIATALTDVGCERDSNFVQGLADIAAAYQQACIASDRAALEAQKRQLDDLLTRATTIFGTSSTALLTAPLTGPTVAG